jgi:site-specific recombinase XerD
LATTLRPSSVDNYRHTVRLFVVYLRQRFPEIRRASQLKRDPHMLGWLEYLWTQRVSSTKMPLSARTRAGHLLRLRKLFELMADHYFPPRPGLLWSQDIPRAEDTLPRPLPPEQDESLQAEFRRRNDLLSNALLLTRLTGVRPGETVDLQVDCLRHLGDGRWLLHVPAVKVFRERWVPVDDEVRTIVARLTYLRMLPAAETAVPPAASQAFLLPRPKGREELGIQLRTALLEAASPCGITTHIVPYQLRHTFATSMLRAGISLPALMKLLGHKKANMTLRYVEITQLDLQRELDLVRLNPRHLVPLPPLASPQIDAADAPAVISRLSAAIRALDLYRQQNLSESPKPLQLLLRRLVRVCSRFQKLASGQK